MGGSERGNGRQQTCDNPGRREEREVSLSSFPSLFRDESVDQAPIWLTELVQIDTGLNRSAFARPATIDHSQPPSHAA
jgi:hypothetical protein